MATRKTDKGSQVICTLGLVMVRLGSVMVRRGSVMVRRGSVDGAAWLS